MDLQLKNKNVLVTGGSKGIGKAIAKAFIEEGANVGIAARSKEQLEKAREELGDVRIYEVDLSQQKEREKLFHHFLEDFKKVDVLVNNAGGSNGGSAFETELDMFYEAMELNYFAPVHLSKLAGTHMKENGAGSIIQITSIFGRESGGKVTYNNAKAALISFTKAFANECIPHNVRVNSIAPGSILHPTGNWQKRLDEHPEKIKKFIEEEIPAGRFGTVEEVANAVLFLASPKSSWLVGTSINVDGGQSRMNF
ncbi:SDR family oxidoreductase [Priestia filamentosa]|uniref:SDR family NAD(P)-dependent oxidoreductase n=1 Tax=Priestia filamentosa TaxID=1402861 RepID=UPI001FB4F21E|nr:SDR family oxidoreductase [Priestia filamentosa]MED3725917.1 SDR family oxidoreductase [Priestia filamentosa]UOE62012.1 SDR family oxidoreductase [Priestia filamentosa]